VSELDEHLMRELYAAHAGMLLGYVRRLLGGDTARAEDVVQETLLRAWQHPDALDPQRAGGASVRSWLVTVARHLVIDHERARKARPREVVPVDHGGGGPTDATTLTDDLDRLLLAQAMAQAIDSLSADHRAVLDLLYFADRSVADAAQSLDIPVGTVKSRAYYALRALRAACEERGIEP
jgi:RNA polymerase sigma-70 factor, ECF subfamily